jgi:hypothetical protein
LIVGHLKSEVGALAAPIAMVLAQLREGNFHQTTIDQTFGEVDLEAIF